MSANRQIQAPVLYSETGFGCISAIWELRSFSSFYHLYRQFKKESEW